MRACAGRCDPGWDYPTSIPRLVPDNHPPPPNLTVRDHVRAVVLAGHEGNHLLVEAAFDSEEAEVRRVALSASQRLGTLDSQLLKRFFADPTATIRRRAAELAPRIPHPSEVIEDLVACLTDEPEVAEMGAFALGEIEQATPVVVESLAAMALRHDDALCREAAVAALGALHAGRETILAALNDKATVRRRAVIALAPFDGPDIDAALQNALEDRDWQVRQAAEDLLPEP